MSYNLTKVKLWTSNEDNILLSLINIHGLKNWKKIETKLFDDFNIKRKAKQCRDRWCNKLMLKETESPINDIEKEKILEVFFQKGPLWSKIAKEIGTRTENQIKNFLNATVRRNVRRYNKLHNYENQIKICSLELLSIEEIRNLLLADKKCKSEYFRKFLVSENSMNVIRQMAENKNRGLAGGGGEILNPITDDIISELDVLLVQREILEISVDKEFYAEDGSPYFDFYES